MGYEILVDAVDRILDIFPVSNMSINYISSEDFYEIRYNNKALRSLDSFNDLIAEESERIESCGITNFYFCYVPGKVRNGRIALAEERD